MNHIISDSIVALVGILLGSFLTYVLSRKKSKDNVDIELYTEYKNIAQELAEALKDVLNLSLIPEYYSKKRCEEIDNALAKFTFKHLLILPPPVLEEINCLHVCLVCGGKNSYMIKRENCVPTLQTRTTEEDIKALLDNVALVTTKRSLFDIYKKYGKLPVSVLLKCQARQVMVVMSECWNMAGMFGWKNKLPKKSILNRLQSNGSIWYKSTKTP